VGGSYNILKTRPKKITGDENSGIASTIKLDAGINDFENVLDI